MCSWKPGNTAETRALPAHQLFHSCQLWMLLAVMEEKQLLRSSSPFLPNRCQLYNRWSKGKNNLSFNEAFALSGKREEFGKASISLFAEGKNNFNPSQCFLLNEEEDRQLCLVPNLSSGKMTSLVNLILQRLRWILRIFYFFFRLSFLLVHILLLPPVSFAHSWVLFSFIELPWVFLFLS